MSVSLCDTVYDDKADRRREVGTMPRGNPQNLVQNQETTPEQRREWARKAGQASQAAQKRRKSSMEIMRAMLSCELTEEEGAKELKALGMDTSYGAGIALMQARRALNGDTEAARFCRDTAGDKPTEALTLALTDKPVKGMDLTQLSDEELEALADRVDGGQE